MHTLKIFTVYDSKAEAYLAPFFCANAAVACRSFQGAVQDPQHDFHRWAADYTLFEIGEWHQDKGELVQHQAHINLGNGLSFLHASENA